MYKGKRMRQKITTVWVILICVILIAVFFRFFGMFQLVSFDETIHVISARELAINEAIKNNHPPLMPLIFHFFWQLFGDNFWPGSVIAVEDCRARSRRGTNPDSAYRTLLQRALPLGFAGQFRG